MYMYLYIIMALRQSSSPPCGVFKSCSFLCSARESTLISIGGVGRAVMGGGGGSKQLKIPPGGGFGKGCKISYIFFGGGGGGGGVWLHL